MASFRDRIELIIDVTTNRATSALGKLRTDMAAAEGATGKLKAGFGNLTSAISASPTALLAAGTAVAAFTGKAVAAFQDLALEAKHMSDATGLSTETASAWIETAGDVGISAEQMESAFGKLNKALAGNKLAEWGITTHDANEAFIQVVATMNRTTDATERGRLAQEAFGRGYQQIAELTSMSANELRHALESVSDAKIIDDSEAAKAVKLRAAMETLRETFETFQLVVGEVAGDALVELADSLEKVDGLLQSISGDSLPSFISDINPLTRMLDGLNGVFEDGASISERFGSALDTVAGGIPVVNKGVDALTDSLFDQNHGIEANTDLSGMLEAQKLQQAIAEEEATQAAEAEQEALEHLADVSEDVTDASDALTEAIQSGTDALNERTDATMTQFDADLAYKDAVDAATEAVNEATGATDANAESVRAAAGAVLDQADAALKNAEAWAAANGITLTAQDRNRILRDELAKVAGTLAPGSPLRAQLEGYIGQLDAVPPTVQTEVDANVSKARAYLQSIIDMLVRISGSRWTADVTGGRFDGPRASGGPVRPGGTYLVGEEGPELLTMGDQSGYVTPNARLAGGTTYIINVSTLDPRSAADAVKETIQLINRREGTAWMRG